MPIDHSYLMWFTFLGGVAALLFLDLGLFARWMPQERPSTHLWLSAFYLAAGLLFGSWVWSQLGPKAGKEYFTGLLVEKSLSLDNLFIIALIFNTFKVPKERQHRVLFLGILGVIVLRGILIGLGAQLVAHFSWMLHLFAIFLILTGIKLFSMPLHYKPDIQKSALLVWLRSHLRITQDFHNGHFWVWLRPDPAQPAKLYVTPLFLALVMVEAADLLFAIDSVPAIFTITQNTYVVYTSNLFAILGLRALYFALNTLLERFCYLKYALAAILVFIGSKGFIAAAFGWAHFPANWSLAGTLGILAAGIAISLYKTRQTEACRDAQRNRPEDGGST